MLLSGCGRFDGTDVQEAVLCALSLDRGGARVVPLAPRRSQLHVVDHTVGDEMDAAPRDILLESARMLHDKIHPIPDFPLETLQALVVPGGFGGAKNLMSGFARLGERRTAQAPRPSNVLIGQMHRDYGLMLLGRTDFVGAERQLLQSLGGIEKADQRRAPLGHFRML
jgi:enhancing lycopene biosynthesis protein 2